MPYGRDHYLGNEKLKAAGTTHNYTPEQISEIMKCEQDVFYFIEHYCKIVHVDKGLIPFHLYNFQKDMLRLCIDNRFFIGKLPRQSGKTSSLVAYTLHYILFNGYKNVAFAANKLDTAIELLDRLKEAYENLPKWLQQGIPDGGWNKKSIKLENGSKVFAAATSSSAIRGKSMSLLILDEFAHIDLNKQQKFYNSTLPTIVSGKTTKVFIISTPQGMDLFYTLWMEATKPPEQKTSKFAPFEIEWNDVPGRDENWKKAMIAELGSEEAFEQEFNTSFIGSSDTLLSKKKLRQLASIVRKPLYYQNDLYVYEDPKTDRIVHENGKTVLIPRKYVLVADTAQGKQLDYSAFVVIDITEVPYKVVATFKSNIISTLVYPQVVYNIAKKYNNAWVLVELNDSPEVAKDLHYEFEYENLFKTQTKGRAGQILSNGFVGKGGLNATVPGVKMSKQVKKIGCAQMKSLIEMDRLVFIDQEIVKQLTNFVSNGPSYAAEEGQHDDLVTPLVLFSWLINQKNFREYMSDGLKNSIRVEYEKELEHNMTPIGFIGSLIAPEPEPEFVSGDWWYPIETIYN